MTFLESIKAKLDTVTSLKIVSIAGEQEWSEVVDTSAALFAILTGVFSTRVWPVHAQRENDYPDAIYTVVRESTNYADDNPVSRTSVYVVTIRDTTYQGLMTAMNSVVDAVAASDYAVQVTDRADDFEADLGVFRTHLEITFESPFVKAPATGDPLYPAALVYPILDIADPSITDNCVKQAVTRTFGIAIYAATADSDSLRADVRGALLGSVMTPTDTHYAMEYDRGDLLDVTGGIRTWRELYHDRYLIAEA